MQVTAVREGTPIHRLAARSVFWEMGADVDPFEKEAWISTTLLSFGDCGFSIGEDATIFFCSPDLARGIAQLPTAPVAPDAAVITSLFSTPAARAFAPLLLDAAVMNLTAREFSAVEAFGYRDYTRAEELLGHKPARIGLLPVDALEGAGFRVVADHPTTPRLRLDLPPVFDLLREENLALLRAQ